jgi:UDP-GlcNAc:undecaprenyl-phosphate GlcNAc-1-phosphate transferase
VSELSGSYSFLAIAALLLAFGATPLVERLARALHVVAEGGEHRSHRGRVPLLGGVAIAIAFGGAVGLGRLFGIAVLDELEAHGWSVGWLAAGTLVVLATGIADDVADLSPSRKLVLQIVAGSMALAGGYGFRAVTNPLTGSYVDFGSFGAAITLLWVVGITNAFNLVDGLDGLASGVGLIAALTLFLVSLVEGRGDAALLAITLAGALTGFLFFNFPPASIFLGDSGSLLLGYLLSVLSIQSLQKGATSVVILVPVLALGLPIMETAVTMLRRSLVAGVASVFRADQEHIHHRLLRLGLNHRRAVLALYAVCAAFSGLAFLAVLTREQGALHAVIVGGVAVAAYVFVRLLGYRG